MAKEFQLKALILGVDKLSPVLDRARKHAMGFRKGLLASGLGRPISLSSVLQGGALAAPFVAGAKAAVDFESSMADVRKVVDFDTPQQFAQMGRDIVDMSKRLPMAAKDIAAIVAAGGQSGIARKDLAAFAEDAVKMGIAFDASADEAGDMMAKWRTSFKLTQPQVVDLADKVNFLSNNTAASAQQISAIVTRIGPLGSVAGLASGEIAAMGATLAGIGVNEEQASTGLKNFMLAMTSGRAATKTQQQVFKALRLNAQAIAAGMQKDAKGTMLKVLDAISHVDPSKQAGVLQQLFGKESITAIAPLLTNLDQLRANLDLVADRTQYAGSMQKEYEARSATTANAIQLMWNRVNALGITIGNILLPPINQFLAFAGPLVDMITAFVQANPGLVTGVLGAAGAFVTLRLGVAGVAAAMRILSMVLSMSPIGIVIRALALGAGLIIANWSTIGPWFADLWALIKAPAMAVWSWLKEAFFNWSPLGIVIKNWEPIVAWFKSLWDRVKAFIDPILNGIDKVKAVTSGIGDTVSNAASSAKETVSNAASSAWNKVTGWFGGGDQAPAQAPVAGDTRLDGQLTVRFVDAPPGTRIDPMQTNQPRLRTSERVGYRTLAGAH
ncbi:phage tail tape measure protein [Castellaniella sp. UC4442_H9]